MTTIEDAGPIVKWVGGKGQLKDVILKEIYRMHPAPIGAYHEPFAGGLSVFFALSAEKRIREAVISDANEELITLYEVVKKDPKPLIRHLRRLSKEFGFSEKAYKEIRAQAQKSPAAIGARFLYLNRVGFNGLYRVNKKGVFNVPYGHPKKPPRILYEDALQAAHLALQRAEILHCSSYECSIAQGLERQCDFMYLDPPYWPTRPTANFTSYTAEDFGEYDQKSLASYFRLLAGKGISALLSNSDVPETRELYKDFVIKKVTARRNINSNGKKRGPVGELLVESRYKKQKKKVA
jgi:DNA adenine methylase